MGHTPGPWKIINGKTIVGPDHPNQGYIADINVHRNNDAWQPDGHANAQLVAAAPDLLAALEDTMKLLRYFRDHRQAEWDAMLTTDTTMELLNVWNANKAAIAKAKGAA